MKTIILAGGSGTRLWPLSRESYPKQFLKINKNCSLFQDAYLRAKKLSDDSEIIIVTNEKYQFMIKNQIIELGYSIPQENILKEPCGRNTLPAVIWGVKRGLEISGDDIFAVFSSDHVLADDAAAVFKKAAEYPASEKIVVFGVKPDTPNTGYGYIHPGTQLKYGYNVTEFKEKPDSAAAEKYVKAGYLWNSGIFLFSSKVFLAEVKKYAEKLYSEFFKDDFDAERDYSGLESVSIDYGLLEKSPEIAVVPLECLWSDLGSFKSIYEVSPHDKDGNSGHSIYIESKDNFVSAGDKKVALVGVENTAVIDSGDALLVCSLEKTELVKKVVNIFAEKNDDIIRNHLTVHRPWGSYTILEEKPFFKIKRVTVNPGSILSLQKHHHRSEHWIVVSGCAEVVKDKETLTLSQGQSTYVPAGMIHRLGNSGVIPLEVIEVQIGEYLGEDDIVRYDDIYGRV